MIAGLVLVVLTLFTGHTKAQPLSEEDIRSSGVNITDNGIFEFYKELGFRFAWNDISQRQSLQRFIDSAANLGLNPADYPLPSSSGKERRDSLITELTLTFSAIQLAFDLYAGAGNPEFRFNGLEYDPKNNTDIIRHLADEIKSRDLAGFLTRIQPNSEPYATVVEQLARFRNTISEPGYTDIRVTAGKADFTNKGLRERLIQFSLWTGLPDSKDSVTYSASIRSAQKKFGHPVTGKLTSSLIRSLNVPLSDRIEELAAAVNFVRWLHSLQESEPVILLNIPSADLRILERNRTRLYSKAIVGKRSTPTLTLTTRVEEVILYPYWNVPHSIATKELLPAIRRDPSYISRNDFQVLDKNGRILDPGSIRWKSLTAANFPYKLRQTTGCDNALGLIKFNFNNPFSIFLHDTNARSLFSKNNRFFSHGCMRVEQAVALGHYLLGDNDIAIDTLTEKGCLESQAPIIIKTNRKVALVVAYQTCWFDESGELIMYDDIYGKLNK